MFIEGKYTPAQFRLGCNKSLRSIAYFPRKFMIDSVDDTPADPTMDEKIRKHSNTASNRPSISGTIKGKRRINKMLSYLGTVNRCGAVLHKLLDPGLP